MRFIVLTLCGLLAGCGPAVPLGRVPVTPQERYDDATNRLAKAWTGFGRSLILGDAAKESFVLGKTDEARDYANELLASIPPFHFFENGNAVFDGNLVLGRIAVKEGRIGDAKRCLLESGKSPGSPNLNTFGPNMSLATDLLKKGEKDAVLEYFELCRKFWRMNDGDLDRWAQEIKAGRIPDFGANLVY